MSNGPAEMRSLILDRFDTIHFDAILETAWHLGVSVLPLADPGAPHEGDLHCFRATE